MARPTERALKRKPMAVILLTTLRKDVPNIPPAGREFEWFTTEDGMRTFFDQNVAFHKEDTDSHDDMAYMSLEVTDTSTMTLGRVDVKPETKEMEDWRAAVEADITLAFTPVKAPEETTEGDEKKKVRPRRKSSAAAAMKKQDDAPDTKAAALKKRLEAKKDEAKKSESGDTAPKPRPKVAASSKPKDEDIVVKKAATA